MEVQKFGSRISFSVRGLFRPDYGVIWGFFLFLKKKKRKKKSHHISSWIYSLRYDVIAVNNPSFSAPYAVDGSAEPTPGKVHIDRHG